MATSITNSYSNFGVNSPIIIQKKNVDSLEISLYSLTKTEISQIEEFFVLNIYDVSDAFLIPSGTNEFKLIVTLKKKTLIVKKNTDYKNLFHAEVITEHLRESTDLWFLFAKESDAQLLETALMSLKNLLDRN